MKKLKAAMATLLFVAMTIAIASVDVLFVAFIGLCACLAVYVIYRAMYFLMYGDDGRTP